MADVDSLRFPLRRFALDALRYAPARLVPVLTALVAAFLFTRLLSATQYGAYALLVAIVAPLAIVLTEWVAQPMGRYYQEYVHEGRRGHYTAVLLRLSALALLLALTAAAILLAWSSPRWGIALASGGAAYLLALVLLALLSPIFPASLDTVFFSATLALIALAQLAVSVAMVLLLGPDPAWLVWGAALATLLAIPLLALRARRHLSPPAASASPVEVRRFVRYGAPMLLWFFAAQLLHVADVWIIGLSHGGHEVGVYSVNYQVATGISGLFGIPITLAFFPIVMRLWAQGRRDELQSLLRVVTDWFALVALACLAVAAATSADIAHVLFGAEFRAGHVVILPVLAGQLLWQASILGHKGLEVMERTRLLLTWALVAAVLNVALNLWLVPQYGYIAAAYTTLFSYLVYAALIWRSSADAIPWEVPAAPLTGYALLGIIGFFLASRLAADPGLVGLMSRAGAAGLVFLLGAIVVKRDDLRAAWRLIRCWGSAR